MMGSYFGNRTLEEQIELEEKREKEDKVWEDIKWRTASGKWIPINKMSTEHVKRVIHLLQERMKEGFKNSTYEYLIRLEMELAIRNRFEQ